jgi:type VI secretion system protein ImpH
MKEPVLPLDERLFEYSFEYNFFQAVRLLHLILAGRPGVGRIAKPGEEPVRFKARESLEFPASSIHGISFETDPPAMTVAFMGLTGVQGVLPHHYTQHILARAQAKDFAMAEFLDLFHHRIISLFYRAWEKHHFPVRFQLAAAQQQTDEFTQYLFDWIGMGTANLRGRTSVPDEALLRYAGLLGQEPPCASALQSMLRDYFGVEVRIEEFMGAWYPLSEDDQCDMSGAGLSNQLGLGAIAGDAVWDPQARFRVRVGPLTLQRYLAFLPDGRAVDELNDLVRFFAGPILQFDMQLVLQAEEVPWCQLGDESPGGPRLGWCGWLKTEEFSRDADDAVFAGG